MVYKKYPIILTCFFLLIGCAHIPQESVQLSQIVGKGITDQNRAYVNLLNEYFAGKRKAIDDFITQTYAPDFMLNLRASTKKDSVQSIPDTVFVKILKKITAKRDSMQANLEKVRIDILTTAQENIVVLSQANAALTALLSSASAVNKSTENMINLADSLSGSRFKFGDFEKTFDQYLINVGNGSAKANDLYDKATQITNGGK